jgi:hypothetical protein
MRAAKHAAPATSPSAPAGVIATLPMMHQGIAGNSPESLNSASDQLKELGPNLSIGKGFWTDADSLLTRFSPTVATS